MQNRLVEMCVHTSPKPVLHVQCALETAPVESQIIEQCAGVAENDFECWTCSNIDSIKFSASVLFWHLQIYTYIKPKLNLHYISQHDCWVCCQFISLGTHCTQPTYGFQSSQIICGKQDRECGKSQLVKKEMNCQHNDKLIQSSTEIRFGI